MALTSNAAGRGPRIGFVAATRAIGNNESTATKVATPAITGRLDTGQRRGVAARARTPGTSRGTDAASRTKAGEAGINSREKVASATREVAYGPFSDKKTAKHVVAYGAGRTERPADTSSSAAARC